MDTQTTIAAVMIFIITTVCLVISIRSFHEKGFLFNNSWIWATAAQKKKLDKKPYYRQSAVIFLLLSAVFAAVDINLITFLPFFMWLSLALTGAAIIYAIVSTIRINRTMEENHRA